MNIDFELDFKFNHMSVKLTFWVRPSQKNQDKKTPIYLRIQMDDTRTEYSIGSYVPLSNWDK